MSIVKILIIEDELLTAKRMQRSLTKNGFEVTGIFSSGESALEEINKNLPDIVLMDIQLKGEMNGIFTAQRIRNLYSLPIIFITQSKDKETFKQAKESFPQNYITKPHKERDLIQAIEMAIQNRQVERNSGKQLESTLDAVFIPTTNNIKTKILFKDILFIQADGAYSKIYVEAEPGDEPKMYTTTHSSNNIVNQIQFPDIVKVHISYYINVKKIDGLSKDSFFIKDIEIPFSTMYCDRTLNNKLLILTHNGTQKENDHV